VLRILGSPTTLCDGLSRRDLLHIGGLGAFGLTLPSFLKLKASEPTRGNDSAFGRAKACILLFPYGSPPQHETFDPKPDAPDGIRGEYGTTQTSRRQGGERCWVEPRTRALSGWCRDPPQDGLAICPPQNRFTSLELALTTERSGRGPSATGCHGFFFLAIPSKVSASARKRCSSRS
jgi:hypothetical protein